MSAFPFADLALSRRLEGAEATSGRRFVEARARVFPDSGATWIEVAGACAMYDGASSPVTQTFGLGLFEEVTAADLDAIEAFYAERGAPVFHEVSPLVDTSVHAVLAARGYRPCEFTSVLYRPIDVAGLKPRATGDEAAAPPANQPGSPVAHGLSPAITVRPIGKGEEELYARVAAEGWSEFGVSDFVMTIGRMSGHIEGTRLFVAELDGIPIAAGALNLGDRIAHLAGASTIPSGRKRGAQRALLEHRLRYAAEHGCDIALMGALPGSGSQRNAERHGFRIAYTRTKWQKS
jgi:GNAT superfamily N-acetyltransferase